MASVGITVTGVPLQKMTVAFPDEDRVWLIVDRDEGNRIALFGAFSALSSVELRKCYEFALYFLSVVPQSTAMYGCVKSARLVEE